MEYVSVITEDVLKKMNLEMWKFNHDTKKYDRKPLNECLPDFVGDEGDYAVFVHKDYDDPTMKYLQERRYYLDMSYMFMLPSKQFDEGTYCGKYLTNHTGHTDILAFCDVKHVYSVRYYWRIVHTDGEITDVPKGETKWAFHVKRG